MDGLKFLIIKGVGSLSGAIVALIIHPPWSLKAGINRGTVSIIGGIVAAGPVRTYLKLDASSDSLFAAAALCSFLSWWVMLIVIAKLKAAHRKASDE